MGDVHAELVDPVVVALVEHDPELGAERTAVAGVDDEVRGRLDSANEGSRTDARSTGEKSSSSTSSKSAPPT